MLKLEGIVSEKLEKRFCLNLEIPLFYYKFNFYVSSVFKDIKISSWNFKDFN